MVARKIRKSFVRIRKISNFANSLNKLILLTLKKERGINYDYCPY